MSLVRRNRAYAPIRHPYRTMAAAVFARAANRAARYAANRGMRAIRNYISHPPAYNGRPHHTTRNPTGRRSNSTRALPIYRAKKRSGYRGWSKSAGFFKVKKKVKRRGSRFDATKKGVMQTTERAGILNVQHTGYVGHITHPKITLMKLTIAALVKKLFVKAGCNVMDLNMAAPVDNTDIIRIRYYKNQESGTTLTTLSYTVAGAGTTTYLTIANQLYAAVTAGAGATAYDIRLHDMAYIPVIKTIAFTELNLNGMLMNVWTKSDLKIQNRTVNAATDIDSEDVDNVPLYGKCYEGKGTGAVLVSQGQVTMSTPFVGDTVYGVIAVNGSNQTGTVEPVMPTMFRGVSKTGKAHLDPGQIKTSVLFESRYYSLDSIFKYFWYTGNDIGTYVIQKFGKFRFFSLEKMIDTIGSDTDATNVNIAIEHNLKMGVCAGWEKMENQTAMNVVLQVGDFNG